MICGRIQWQGERPRAIGATMQKRSEPPSTLTPEILWFTDEDARQTEDSEAVAAFVRRVVSKTIGKLPPAERTLITNTGPLKVELANIGPVAHDDLDDEIAGEIGGFSVEDRSLLVIRASRASRIPSGVPDGPSSPTTSRSNGVPHRLEAGR